MILLKERKKPLFNFFLLPNLMCFWNVLFLDGITVRTLFSEAECNLCNKVFAEHWLSECTLEFLLAFFCIQLFKELHGPVNTVKILMCSRSRERNAILYGSWKNILLCHKVVWVFFFKSNTLHTCTKSTLNI